MKLFEEYLSRHNIIDIPLVHHCNHAFLLLKNDKSWSLLSIDWLPHDRHPGHYVIKIQKPVYDGYLIGKLFTTAVYAEVKWNEYENYLLNQCSFFSGLKPIASKNAVISAWEIFVYTHDSWFSKQNYQIKDKLFKSLDNELSFEERYSAYQDAAMLISTHQPAIMHSWKYELLLKLQNQAMWLEALINSKKY